MKALIPDPGNIFVSIDLAAGEPSVTTHFSQDPVYRYCTFDGVGKAPFYRDGRLWIDDIYLATAAINPLHTALMNEAFTRKWPAGSFADQWLADAEVIKKELKNARQFNKMAALGFSYGMGAAKFVKQAYDQGYEISVADARKLHKSYWTLFAGVKAFADKCARQVENDGYIVNPFGYRGCPSPHKAFNFFIQGSVSGIIHVLLAQLADIAPYMHLITVIHDELVCMVPSEKLEQFRRDVNTATDALNNALKWSVRIRTGFAPGKDLYDAK